MGLFLLAGRWNLVDFFQSRNIFYLVLGIVLELFHLCLFPLITESLSKCLQKEKLHSSSREWGEVVTWLYLVREGSSYEDFQPILLLELTNPQISEPFFYFEVQISLVIVDFSLLRLDLINSHLPAVIIYSFTFQLLKFCLFLFSYLELCRFTSF